MPDSISYTILYALKYEKEHLETLIKELEEMGIDDVSDYNNKAIYNTALFYVMRRIKEIEEMPK